MKAIELFAGIGGFRLGMEPAGIDTIWANDIDKTACNVYQDHFGSGSIVCADVRNVDIETIPKHDLLTAGFPCQPFSAAGKKLGINDQVTGTLFYRIVEILQHRSPSFFFLENVKRIIGMEEGMHFKKILDELTKLDYLVEWRVLNAKYFGIPQNRERVFIVGTRLTKTNSLFDTMSLNSVLLTQRDLGVLKIWDTPDPLDAMSKDRKSVV